MNLLKKLLKRKIVLLIIVAVVIFIGYYGYKTIFVKAVPPSYVTSTAEKGTIIVSISGSGQVSSSNQIDLKSKASGDITYVGVTQGQIVKAGTVIAQIDATDAYKTIRDAQSNLKSAQASLKKLKEPVDELTLLQAQNALSQAQQAKATAEDNLDKAYDDAFTSISDAFINLPTAITGLHDILYGTYSVTGQAYLDYYYDLTKKFDINAITYRNNTDNFYQAAKTAYDKNFQDYNNASRHSGTSTILELLNETYTTAKTMADATKSTYDFLSYVKDEISNTDTIMPSQLAGQQTSIATYTSTINSQLANLLSSINTITNDNNSIASSEFTIKEKTLMLQNAEEGAAEIDLETAQLSVTKAQETLADAQQALADYSIKAPFDGVIASIDVKKYDSINSGVAIATLVTEQQLATISVNEVDAAKIKIGQKVTLTFDAIDELSISGQVAQIDTLGTVSSGVVSYTVTINFDTQDSRVLPGMSVNASIIIDSKQDVLVVPNGAIKTSNGINYVEVFNLPLLTTGGTQGMESEVVPSQQTVEIGLSDDTLTEIISGLNEGDQVVTKTIAGSTETKTQTSILSLFGIGGNRTTAAKTSTTNSSKTTGSSATQSMPTGSAGPPPGF